MHDDNKVDLGKISAGSDIFQAADLILLTLPKYHFSSAALNSSPMVMFILRNWKCQLILMMTMLIFYYIDRFQGDKRSVSSHGSAITSESRRPDTQTIQTDRQRSRQRDPDRRSTTATVTAVAAVSEVQILSLGKLRPPHDWASPNSRATSPSAIFRRLIQIIEPSPDNTLSI